MTLNDLVATIHLSIHETNMEHAKWTGGWWVTAYGVESYIVGNIARSIMSLERPPTYVTLETKFSELYDNNGIKPKTPSREASKGNNRLDLALYSGERLCYAIEFKRFWDPRCLNDIDRLCCLIRTLCRAKGGSLRAGIFALLATAKSRRPDEAINNLDRAFERYEKKCSNHLKKNWMDKGISSYDFFRSTSLITPVTTGDGQAFSSFCVVVK